MFGISGGEFLLLLVVAVIMFGPEKIPAYSRKAARIFVYLRDIANNAQNQLREELGPEFADLDIKDLNPKTFVAKHMQAEMELLEETKRELQQASSSFQEATDEVRSTVTAATALATAEAADAQRALTAKATSNPTVTKPTVPFDIEAT